MKGHLQVHAAGTSSPVPPELDLLTAGSCGFHCSKVQFDWRMRSSAESPDEENVRSGCTWSDHPAECLSCESGAQISNIVVCWELVRNAGPQAPAPTPLSQDLHFNQAPGRVTGTAKCEKHGSTGHMCFPALLRGREGASGRRRWEMLDPSLFFLHIQ